MLGPLFTLAGAAIGLWSQSRPFADRSSDWAPAPSGASVERVVGMPSLAPVVERVAAGVVGIHTVHEPDDQTEIDLEIESTQNAGQQVSLGVSRGTGFVLHEDGLILTAHHLVARPSMIIVEIPGIGKLEAELVGDDPSTDLAVVRIVDPRTTCSSSASLNLTACARATGS